VPGETAAAYVALARQQGRAGLPEADALAIVKAATRGLAAVHQARLVHRDIKPEDLIIPDDRFDRARLSGFGLARPEGSAAKGTPGFIAPELIEEGRWIGPPADVFAMGATLHALLAGRSPFEGPEPGATLKNTLEHEPALLPEKIRPTVRELVGRCLKKKYSHRYRDGAALLEALEALDGAVAPAPAPARAPVHAAPAPRAPAAPPEPSHAHDRPPVGLTGIEIADGPAPAFKAKHQERRKYPRTKPDPDLGITAWSADLDLAHGPRSNVAVKIVDVSTKGACIVTVGRLREGVVLALEFADQRASDRLRAKGVVRWSQTLQHKNREAHVAGVELTEIQEIRGQRLAFMAAFDRAATKALAEAQNTGRRNARFAAGNVHVTCVPKTMWKALGLGKKNVATGLQDLSLGGLQILAAEKVEVGERLDIRLDFKTPDASVEAEGEVRNCKRDTLVLESKWYVGIAFTHITDENRDRLRQIASLYLGGG
jgi:hypothetical protein